MSNPPKCLIATAMRNEGAFIVEWVTWYRMLGFDIVVATNDCTDHSPQLLDALAQAGWLTHVPHDPPDGMPPQKAAHRLLHKHPLVRAADWVLTCDVDEFLVLHHADTVQDYLGPPPWDCLGIAFSWKNFGTSGWQRYQPGLVHRQFKRTGVPKQPTNRPFKSMHRRADMFARLGAHTPHGFRGDWSDPENAWVNGAGEVLPEFAERDNHPIRFLLKRQIDHDAAQMNHYVLRSVEHYAAKKGTLSASSFTDRYTDDFFDRRDKNGMKDDTALRFAARFDPLFAQAMAFPGVARLHHLCCADYVARLCAAQGRDPQDDARWQDAMAAADAAG